MGEDHLHQPSYKVLFVPDVPWAYGLLAKRIWLQRVLFQLCNYQKADDKIFLCKFSKMLSPSCIILRIQRQEGKHYRPRWGGSFWGTSLRFTLFANLAIFVSSSQSEDPMQNTVAPPPPPHPPFFAKKYLKNLMDRLHVNHLLFFFFFFFHFSYIIYKQHSRHPIKLYLYVTKHFTYNSR